MNAVPLSVTVTIVAMREKVSAAKPRVVVLDYGSGNLRSAERALARAGADVSVMLLGASGTGKELLAKGVHGIFVLGTTGEFYALDETEKQRVMAAGVDHDNTGVA